MPAIKRTKIITTLGPATDDHEMLKKMLLAGVDLVRLNFSHGDVADHQRRVHSVRQISKELGREIGVLADLQGPKIRISRFKDNAIVLNSGSSFALDTELANDVGNQTEVGLIYKSLPQDVKSGDTLLLDDGRIVLDVTAVSATRIETTVKVGGRLSNSKGINRLGGGLSAKALTEKDKVDIKAAVALQADYIAISFPRNADDVFEAKALVKAAGSNAGVIAKIERIEAVENLVAITKASDGVMVARGDLGVEIGDAELMAVQKDIIQTARSLNKAVITATQMMESMITNPIPTRAEVSDVANAVLDGTDAVMLSAETATGDHPDLVVSTMSRICVGAERHPRNKHSKHRVECEFASADEAIAMATMYTANHMNIQAIVSLTESGGTPLWMSRIRSGIPIIALSRHVETERRVTLFRGVYSIHFDVTLHEEYAINKAAVERLLEHKIVTKDDSIILTRGDLRGIHGSTNTMKILKIDEVI